MTENSQNNFEKEQLGEFTLSDVQVCSHWDRQTDGTGRKISGTE